MKGGWVVQDSEREFEYNEMGHSLGKGGGGAPG